MKNILLLVIFFGLSFNAFAQKNAGVSLDDNDALKIEIEKRIKDAKKKGPRFALVGQIEANRKNYLMINGEAIRKDKRTKIIGSANTGANAKVKGMIINGEKIATHVIANRNKFVRSKEDGDERKQFDGEILNSLGE